MKNFIGLRHGDLSFHKLDKLPDGVKELEFSGEFVVARGEHTGHEHRIVAPKQNVKIFQDTEGRYVLQVLGEATITHEEHAVRTFMPGIYIQQQELERDPFLQRIRRVID